MCHSSSSWSEIQYSNQNLIYDQPVGKGAGRPKHSIPTYHTAGEIGDARGSKKSCVLKEFGQTPCAKMWKEPAGGNSAAEPQPHPVWK